MAHEIDVETVAEFVENDAIVSVLRELGVDFVQGYGVGSPAPLPGPTCCKPK